LSYKNILSSYKVAIKLFHKCDDEEKLTSHKVTKFHKCDDEEKLTSHKVAIKLLHKCDDDREAHIA